MVTFLSFWVYLCPLVGGWLADAKWGRYKTIQRGIYCSIFAHILIVISGIPQVIARDGASIAMLVIGIIVLGFGTGAFKPNISVRQYPRWPRPQTLNWRIITAPSRRAIPSQASLRPHAHVR